MELRDYLSILREHWLAILVCVLSGTLVAGLITMVTKPTYEATSQIFVSVQTQDGSTQGLALGSSYSQAQVAGFAELATSPLVLEPVVQDLGLASSPQSLAGQVQASVRLNTSLVNITASAQDPNEAAALSNSVAKSMTVVLPELQRPLDSAVSPVRISITRNAVVPISQASPSLRVNLALGILVGLALGVGIALLRTMLDTRVRTESLVAALTERPIIGSITYDLEASKSPLAILSQPLGTRAEAVRRLRTNLQFINAPSRLRSIVVTSSLPGEGKSTTAANLALAMADAGSRVILVDGDLRRPSLANVLGLEGAVGLTTVLIGQAELIDVVQPFQSTGLDVITAGGIPPNPSELLGSSQMRDVLEYLTDSYDIVIIDSAPLLPVTDGAVLAKQADGAMLVIGAHKAHRPQVLAALAMLEGVGARVLGVVLNQASVTKRGTYGYYEYAASTETGGAARGRRGKGRSD